MATHADTFKHALAVDACDAGRALRQLHRIAGYESSRPSMQGAMGMNRNIFVYGTLRKDQSNHHLLAGAEFLSYGRTPAKYRLVSMGGYPAMLHDGEISVYGEIYSATPEMVKRMDHLEGHPDYYRRTPIVLADGVEVEAYICQDEGSAGGRPAISSGDWVKYRRDFMEWYCSK